MAPAPPAAVEPAPPAAIETATAASSTQSDVEDFDPDLAAIDPDYPGDDAPKAEIAKWMAKEAERARHPARAAGDGRARRVQPANLDHGHSTSLGYFQMLEHLWNPGEYKGYPDNPRAAARMVPRHGRAGQEGARRRRQADRRPAAVRRVDRRRREPAAEYRGRYQLRLDEARKLLK